MFAAVLARTFGDHAKYRIAASEIEAIESRRAIPALASGVAT
jgi:hypothetical protein